MVLRYAIASIFIFEPTKYVFNIAKTSKISGLNFQTCGVLIYKLIMHFQIESRMRFQRDYSQLYTIRAALCA